MLHVLVCLPILCVILGEKVSGSESRNKEAKVSKAKIQKELSLNCLVRKCFKMKYVFQGHFTNSVFQKPGIYSCAVECFLEVSRYVFFPFLSKLSTRSKFPDLLFNAVADYCQFTDNIQLLSEIREPVWLYLRQHCSSFEARDCNAAFSQIFEEKIFGTLNTEEVNLFATQRMFESYCERCEKKLH